MKIIIKKKFNWNFYVLAIFYQNIIILMMLLENVKSDWLMECGNCRCKWNSGKKTADCKNLTLSNVPLGLSTEIQVLDLSLNKIKKIEENSFVKTELENLHKLFARNCSMERVHPLSFKGLGILIELDLSNNIIKQLPRDAFSYLIKVRSIVINNNLLEILDNGLIRNLKYLHKIELKENRIIKVNTDVFQNVPYLQQIFLNGNQLSFLRKESFEKLKRLASLSLDSNPWNCTCELQVFRDFALKRNLYTPPTSCYYPIHLRGVLWNDEQSGAFACKPKIIYPSKGASINTSKENVTLICRVHASPNTVIAWDYNKQIYSSINYQARVHIQLLREENPNPENKEIGRDIFISRLTIIGAEKSDEGVYTCLAENPGGKDEVQMSLLVQKHNSQDLLLQNNLLIVICLMVLGLLSASIFLALITCCIYKKFKNLNHRHHHHHHHHHHNHGGSQISEDSLENEKRRQAVNSTVVITNTGDMNYTQQHDTTTITDVDQQQLDYQQQIQNKRNDKIPNGNGLIIDSRISSLTADGSNTKDSLQNQQDEITQSNCSTNATTKLQSSAKEKSYLSKTSSHFGSNIIAQQSNFEHQIQENKLSDYHKKSTIGYHDKQNLSKDYQPDLLPYNPTSQSISLTETKPYTNTYSTLNKSNLYESSNSNINLKLEQQLQHHETIYSNNFKQNTSNSSQQQKDSNNIKYGQYNEQKYPYNNKHSLNLQQQQKYQQSVENNDQNNDIQYASILPRNKYITKNDVDDDNIGSIGGGGGDYFYNTHKRKLSASISSEAGGLLTSMPTGTGTTLGINNIKGLESITRLGATTSTTTTTTTTALDDYLQTGFIEIPSTSATSSIIMSNSLKNGYIQQQQQQQIDNNNRNAIPSNSSGKLHKYQYNKIPNNQAFIYNDEKPPTILSTSAAALNSLSIKSSSMNKNVEQQQNFNNIAIEPSDLNHFVGGGGANSGSIATTILDDKYYHYDSSDVKKQQHHQQQQQSEEEILPHKQSTIVTTSPSMNFLTNFYPRRELL